MSKFHKIQRKNRAKINFATRLRKKNCTFAANFDKTMKKIAFLTAILTVSVSITAADIKGIVLDDEGQTLVGANVYWLGTTQGTVTDLDGRFSLPKERQHNQLVTSYTGYHADTTTVSGTQELTIVLVSDLILDEVTITERRMSVYRNRFEAFDVSTIQSDELCKAACCNLSEAFETNASVDVSYADAATGAKQIKLLGLSGTYVQLLHENTPGVRGLAQSYGMEYIPGPWMQSIQVSKGTSSVVNGYEATTGQINVEFLKPQTTSPLAINLMLNSELHAEANLTGGWQIPLHQHEGEEHEDEEHHHEHGEHCHHQSLYTGLLAHYQQGFIAMDDNRDGFVEMPKTQNANLINRWFYKHGDYTFQAFVRGLYDHRRGGQMADSLTNPYRIDLTTYRVEGFIKNGYVYDQESGSSIAIIAAANYHNMSNLYGLRTWLAAQTNAYLNALWQGNFEGKGDIDNDHRLTAGLSLNFDKYDESLKDILQLDRQELTAGLFAEYNLKYEDKLSLVAGVRGDYSTRYGFFFTPRLNIRYTPWKWWTIRASAGLGYRSPNILADNAFILPSSRTISIDSDIAQECAVNTGVSTTFYIPLGQRELQLSAEYYYTRFLNSTIVDLDQDPNAVHIYSQRSVNATSFAHNAQIEASIEVLRGWTWTAAFRWTDVRQTTINADGIAQLRLKPLSNQFKGIITTSYQTPLKKWQFDITAQFNGGGRMPDGFADYYLNQIQSNQYYQQGNTLYYKWYPQLMAQITKYWRTCSLYVGAENMTNFKQQNPVINAEQPYDTGFDASMAWGPLTGWKLYAGFRWAL